MEVYFIYEKTLDIIINVTLNSVERFNTKDEVIFFFLSNNTSANSSEI